MTIRSEIVPSWIRLGARAAFFIGLGVIVYLSLMLNDWTPFSDISDKLKHGSAYLVLTLCGAFGFPRTRALVLIGLALFCLGCGLEGAQGFVPGRVPDVADIVANTIGVVIGLASAWLVIECASRRWAVGSDRNRR